MKTKLFFIAAVAVMFIFSACSSPVDKEKTEAQLRMDSLQAKIDTLQANQMFLYKNLQELTRLTGSINENVLKLQGDN